MARRRLPRAKQEPSEALLPQAGVIRTAVRLNRRHARQDLFVSAIGQAADSAHEPASILLAAQLVDLGFNVKKLYALKAAINQAGHAVQKSQAEEISVDEQEQR